MKNFAIVLAGGSGSRFGKVINKSFAPLGRHVVIEHILKTYESHPDIDAVVVVIKKQLLEKCKEIITKANYKKVLAVVEGGHNRQESTMEGLIACKSYNPEKVLIQESVRPFTSAKIISESLGYLDSFTATVALAPPVDAVLIVNKDGVVINIPEKSLLGGGQSPEGFIFDSIFRAHEFAVRDHLNDTPENCALVLRYKLGKIKTIESDRVNFKITQPIDLLLAEAYLKKNQPL